MEQGGGAHIAEHGLASDSIAQRVVRIQITMQQAALMQMGDGGAKVLYQALRCCGRQAQARGIDIAGTALETGWPSQR